MLDRRGARVTFVTVPDAAVSGFPTRGFTRKATWYRLLVPDLIAPAKALWLDADALVVDDLEHLWRTEVGSGYLAAVVNLFQDDHLEHAHKLELDPRRYFNAGVMLMDLQAMRRDDCARRLREFTVANAERLTWRDQDALNLVLGDAWEELHPRWNCMLSIMRFATAERVFGRTATLEARTNPGIRHFEGPGPNKPWHVEADPGDQRLYAEARAATPWPRVRLERTPLLARLRTGVRNALDRLGQTRA
jgi:lipopolysaccharide biosynthesis glycosyltransferase